MPQERFSIGLLDFGYRTPVTTHSTLLNDLYEYAEQADALGYTHLWLGEHHLAGKGWTNPQMLLPVLAGLTSQMRIGIAGVLLPLYPAYEIAVHFKLLANMYPGRIDLGLANGKSDAVILNKMLGTDVAPTREQIEEKVKELFMYFRNEEQLYRQDEFFIPPLRGTAPLVWRLSKSFDRIADCVESGAFFSRSLFHSELETESVKAQLQQFRENYHARYGFYPRINLAFAGVLRAASQDAMRVAGRLAADQPAYANHYLTGSPATFHDQLCQWQEITGISDFTFYDLDKDLRQRRQTLELLATIAGGKNDVHA